MIWMHNWHSREVARVFPGFAPRERRPGPGGPATDGRSDRRTTGKGWPRSGVSPIAKASQRAAERVPTASPKRLTRRSASEAAGDAPSAFSVLPDRRRKGPAALDDATTGQRAKPQAWPVDSADRAYAPMQIIEAYVDTVRRAQGKPTYAEIHLGTPDFEAQLKDFASDVFKAMGADGA